MYPTKELSPLKYFLAQAAAVFPLKLSTLSKSLEISFQSPNNTWYDASVDANAEFDCNVSKIPIFAAFTYRLTSVSVGPRSTKLPTSA